MLWNLLDSGLMKTMATTETEMNLRQLVIERIFFAVTDEELATLYQLKASDIQDLSDLDLFELYENVIIDLVAPEFIQK